MQISVPKVSDALLHCISPKLPLALHLLKALSLLLGTLGGEPRRHSL